MARRAREAVEGRSSQATAIITAVVVLGAVALGYMAWRDRVQSSADGMLAEAMTVAVTRVGAPIAPGTPGAGPSFPSEPARAQAALAKFKAAADAYPSTDAGLFARYQQATTAMALGNAADAALAYQQVIDRAGGRIYAQMAKLGLAEAQARAGQYDQAISAFRDLAQVKDGPLPVDAILMRLAQTYRDAGKPAEALQTLNRVLEEYPDSSFGADARREVDKLKKS
ncbi:MAG: tetratricopeptide repeat protein [Vicinamibacterales bacterium]